MKKQMFLCMALAIAQLYGAADRYSPAVTKPSSSKTDWRLIAAVRAGNVANVSKLLKLEVDINQGTPQTDGKDKSTGGETALHLALQELYHPSFKDLCTVSGEPLDNRFEVIARLLLHDPRIDVNQQNGAGATPLHMLAGFIHESSLPSTGIDEVRCLDINEKTRTDLKRVAELLLRKGANPNMRDKNGTTPLHWAAIHGLSDLVSTLINAGTTVDAQNKLRQTALMCAAHKGYAYIMQQLLIANANANLQDHMGRTALFWIRCIREGALIKECDQMAHRALRVIHNLLINAAVPGYRPVASYTQYNPTPIAASSAIPALLSPKRTCHELENDFSSGKTQGVYATTSADHIKALAISPAREHLNAFLPLYLHTLRIGTTEQKTGVVQRLLDEKLFEEFEKILDNKTDLFHKTAKEIVNSPFLADYKKYFLSRD